MLPMRLTVEQLSGLDRLAQKSAQNLVDALQRSWPELPVGGAFAAGEIGPVCGRPYVHGLSACIGLLAETA